MTSEGHHHADGATDTAGTTEPGSPQPSGFGLFEAPSVPDTFPTFAPSHRSDVSSPFPTFGEPQPNATEPVAHTDGYASGSTPGEFSHVDGAATGTMYGGSSTSGGFAGFPPDEPEGSTYVPAPAVVPIPAASTPEPDAPWSAYASTPPNDEEPSWSAYSQTPPPNEHPTWSDFARSTESAEPPAAGPSWSTFTTPADPEPEPVPQQEQSDWYASASQPEPQASWTTFTSTNATEAAEPQIVPAEYAPPQEQRIPGATLTGSWPAFEEPRTTPPADRWAESAYREPVSQSSEPETSPQPSSHPWETPSQSPDAAARPWETPSQSPDATARPWETPDQSSEMATPNSAGEPSLPQRVPSTEPWVPTTAGDPWLAAPETSTDGSTPGGASSWQVEPENEPPSDPAYSTPSEQAPSVPAAPMRASASVPVASRIAPPSDAVSVPRGEPRLYGTAPRADAGQPPVAPEAQPVIPQQAGAPAQEQVARPVVARATVAVARATPAELAEVQQPATMPGGVYGRPQPTVYGSATSAATAPAAAPAVTSAATPGAPPAQAIAAAYPGQQVHTPATPSDGPQRSPGMPPYGDLLGPATPSQAPEQPRQPATAMIPAQRAPIEQPEAQDRFNKFKSAEEAAPAPVRSSKVLLLVIGACVALLGLALGSLYFVGNILDPGDSPSFTVGQCVKENSGDAVAAQCSDAGAFSVVQIVDNAEKCPDQNQPTIKQGTEILCLKPAAAEPAAQ